MKAVKKEHLDPQQRKEKNRNGIGKRIKTAMIERDISAKELEISCGMGQGHISRITTGINEPSASSLVKIAKALDVSADYLLGLKEDFK